MMDTDGIIIWTAAVDEVPASLWMQLDELLDGTERQRAARFHFDHHTKQYTLAHALKRLMLTAFDTSISPEAWTFETGAAGKPRVAKGAGPEFNLSHCNSLVACAASKWVELGVDVENLKQPAALEIADILAPAEEAWLRRLSPAAQSEGFFRLWTLKEAYVKAIGAGLSQPLSSFAIGFDPLRISFADRSLGDPAVWRFDQRLIGPSYILALAWRSPGAELPVKCSAVRLENLFARIYDPSQEYWNLSTKR